jgi:hypothetical protein
VRFVDFLKATVLASAGAATALAAVTVAGAANHDDQVLVPAIAAWWLFAAALGMWLGRGQRANRDIARLLTQARAATSLPEHSPSRVLLNRLWPLLLATVGAGALAFLAPQVPGVAPGFAIVLSLTLRHQEKAVEAIEERDGVAFYVEHTSPLRPMKLIRTPGFRRNVAPLPG